ncbi:MAG: hypothetical protein GWP08_09785 [Nitrospiraceae bacterium]|nr:hypothetical protein [Nitrospiraceae bacterium]
MTNVMSKTAYWTAAMCACALLAAGAAPCQEGWLGDVNLDGRTDVLDIQGGISQAVGAAAASFEADVDENDEVNILDVQHLINTTLGVGGLMQRVQGFVDIPGNMPRLRVIAISHEGQRVSAEIDPETGAFELRLRTRTSWAMAVCGRIQGQWRCLATFEFPVGQATSCTLPLPRLSRGVTLRLGTVLLEHNRMRVEQELQTLLGSLEKPADRTDRNGNGVPDFIEPLLRRAADAPGVPAQADVDALLALTAECIEEWLAQEPMLDLTDEEGNGMPDFVDGLLACLKDALPEWLRTQGVPATDMSGRERLVAAVMDHVRQTVKAWLGTLDRDSLIDADDDGVPDFIQPQLSTGSLGGVMDQNGNLTPDFAEDHDGDGVPNIDDEDWHAGGGDHDRDGVADVLDWDDDNDGIPDYADDSPLDPVAALATQGL